MAYSAYWDDCNLALSFNADPPVDDKGGTVSLLGDASVATAIFDTSPSALYCGPAGTGRVTVSTPILATVGTGPFTLAFSCYLSNRDTKQYLAYVTGGGTTFGVYAHMQMIRLEAMGDVVVSSAYGLPVDTLLRVMISRDASGITRIMVNGQVEGTSSALGGVDLSILDGSLTLGNWYWANQGVLNGYIDEVYFVPGVALETANYTVQPFFNAGAGPEPLQVVPLEIDVIATRSIELALDIAVIQTVSITPVGLDVVVVTPAVLAGSALVSDGGTSAAQWKPVVYIDDVDRSADLIGDVHVKAERGAARIATFTLHMTGEVDVTGYTGKPVQIDFAAADGSNALRLFTGIVDLPALDLVARSVSFDCTDNLQIVVNAMDRTAIDSLIGGRWSSAIFDAGASNWSYAQDRLTTVQASVDLTPLGAVRLTPWTTGSVDFNFDDNLIIDDSISISPAERNQLVNRIEIDFGYRFPRAKREGHYIDYTYLTDGFGPWLLSGNSLLTRSAVLSAIENAGGNTTDIAWDALPTGGWIKTPLGGMVPYVGNPYVDPLLCLGFQATVTFDYTQTVDETHKITVLSQESIDAVGDMKESMSGALVGETADTVAVETNNRLYQLGLSNIPPMDAPAVILGKTNAAALTLTDDTNRAAAENAIETLIDIAKTRIVKSHLGTTLSATLPLHPLIDLDKTVSIDCDGVQTTGRVDYVEHRMAADQAEPLTNFRLAICRVGAAGTPDVEVPTAAPSGVADGETGTLQPVICAFHGLVGEDASFELTFPAVDTAQRDGEQIDIASEFMVALATDPLTINFGA